MISWFSTKQSSVALSTAKVEYLVAYSTSCEAIWLQKLMSGLFNLELDTTVILCDNQICDDREPYVLSQHIEIQYFYIWYKKEMMMLQYFHTEDIDDVFT